MVAPYMTRSSLAQSALAMHIGHGSQVEYIVYPDKDGRLSFLQARRTVRVSAWQLGSFSRRTALVPRMSRSLVRVLTINAPKGTGCAVSKERAVNWKISRMRASSIATGPAATFAQGAMRQFITRFGRMRQGLDRIFVWNGLGGRRENAACYSSRQVPIPPGVDPHAGLKLAGIGRGLHFEPAGICTALWATPYEQVCFLHPLPSLSRWPLRVGLPAFIKRIRIDEGYLAGRLVPTARTWRFLHGA